MNPSCNQFNYYVGSHTKRMGRPPKFYTPQELSVAHCQFSSVYAVRAEDARLIYEAGTVEGFKGVVWSERLWVDFDDKLSADKAENWLINGGYEYEVYDTGGTRGCHLSIKRDCDPSHLLPERDKRWVRENLGGADLSLYWHLHLLRLPGAIHEKTGRTKQLIRQRAGRAVSLPPYDAKSDTSPSPPLSPSDRPSLFSNWSIMSKVHVDNKAERHQQLVNMTVMLRKSSFAMAEARWVVLEANKGFSEPKSEFEVDRILDWVYSSF